MSLQGLISGSECAVPFNPLSQVLKHTEGDRSLQQDRIAGASSARLHHLPSTSAAPGTERDLALARQFFDGNVSSPGSGPAFSVANHLPPQMTRPMEGIPRAAADLSSAWNEMGDETAFQSHLMRREVGPSSVSGWSSEFSRASGVSAPGTVQSNALQRPEYSQTSYMPSSLYGGAMGRPMMYGASFTPMGSSVQFLDSGKGKGKEIDFEAAFAEVAASLTSNQADSGRIVEVSDDVANVADSLRGTRLEGQQDGNEEPLQYGTDFRKVWDHLQNSSLPPPSEDLAKWEAQFNHLTSSQREEDEFDYGSMMRQSWENGLGAGAYDAFGNEGQVEFTNEGLPVLGPYIFEKENKFLDPSASTRSSLQAAKDLLEQNGSLSDVALLLEAAIQQGELGTGGYEAWILLGETRSMDEREDAAMRALTEGIKKAEEAGAAGEGMLSLAISYTNEAYERASHAMLLRWLKARFPSFDTPTMDEAFKSLSSPGWSSHERVTDVFLSLAREQYSRGEMDPDVQIALGVLFYTNNEYDRAKDCFEAALAVRPKDYILWNRMGSALSNGSKPEEALGAYREALQLRPTYTRAIYNVAVACLNIGAFKEAAEHILSALAMQESSGGAKSDQLWHTLRRVMLSMGRADLADMAKSTMDVEVFRKEGFDF